MRNDGFPTYCPNDGCDDKIPATPGLLLQDLLRKYKDRVKESGIYTKEAITLELSICAEVTVEYERETLTSRARRNGLPTKIDFKALPDRMKKMQGRLEKLVLVDGVSDDNPVLISLRDNI